MLRIAKGVKGTGSGNGIWLDEKTEHDLKAAGLEGKRF